MKRLSPPFTSMSPLKQREPLVEVTLQVVTPMFGGSAEPGEVDPEFPIRGSTIRGHLRFWWRACNGHRFSSVDQLFQEEAEIWGKTSGNQGTPSAIDIEVVVNDRGQMVPNNADPLASLWMNDEGGYPSYGLFPFQRQRPGPGRPGRPAQRGRVGINFTVALIRAAHVHPTQEPRVKAAAEAALWAWIIFGGVGARTRRGCGTLWCGDAHFHPSQPGHAPSWLREQAQRHLAHPAASPTLSLPLLQNSHVFLQQQPMNLPDAWRVAVNWLQSYRQGKDIARRPGSDPSKPKKLGRSYWPEPDAIRLISRSYAPGHEPDTAIGAYFPRAELGLPIIFHFIDNEAGDPDDHTLALALDGATRMASPIITKPLMVSATSGIPMVVRLNAPRLSTLGVPIEITPKGGAPTPLRNPNDIFDPAKARLVKPLRDYGADNPLDGFVEFLKRRGSIRQVVL